MSSAHYFVKNYNIRQVLDLMCYETQFPHTLTSTQKITRMYRYSFININKMPPQKRKVNHHEWKPWLPVRLLQQHLHVQTKVTPPFQHQLIVSSVQVNPRNVWKQNQSQHGSHSALQPLQTLLCHLRQVSRLQQSRTWLWSIRLLFRQTSGQNPSRRDTHLLSRLSTRRQCLAHQPTHGIWRRSRYQRFQETMNFLISSDTNI